MEPVADCHAGAITALRALPSSPGKLLSAGNDGSLRVWDAAGGGQMCARRDLAACRPTAMAACATRGLVAVGSHGGVLRLVAVAGGSSDELPVVWRARLGRGPISHLAFSPGGEVVAVVCSLVDNSPECSDRCSGSDAAGAAAASRRGSSSAPATPHAPKEPGDAIAFVQLGSSSDSLARLLGYADSGRKVLSACWLPADAPGGSQLLVSLASGLLTSFTAPAAAAPVVVPKSPAAFPTMPLPVPQLRTRSVAIEVPLVHIAAVRRQQPQGRGAAADALLLVGFSTCDRKLHSFALPSQAAAWASFERPPLRSVTAQLAHAKPGTALGLSPCGRFVATAGGDGTLSLRDAVSLTEVGGGGLQAQQPRAHVSAADGACCVCFDAGGGWLASGGTDGSLFISKASGTISGGAAAPADAAASAQLQAAHAQAAAAASVDAADDDAEPLLLQVLAEAARQEEEVRGAATRARTAEKLEELKERLAALLARNAAAPEEERLSEEEVIIDVERLQVTSDETSHFDCGCSGTWVYLCSLHTSDATHHLNLLACAHFSGVPGAAVRGRCGGQGAADAAVGGGRAGRDRRSAHQGGVLGQHAGESGGC